MSALHKEKMMASFDDKAKGMAGIRDKAEEVLRVVPTAGQITSNGKTADTFTKLTGTSQETMKKNWDAGGIMTACNGFVGWYARMLRSKVDGTMAPPDYLGRFDLETFLPSIGMGHAWIKSTADGRPKYGDICRHTAFHVGVSLDFDGDYWNHVDAGQGGPKVGCDILKRTRSATPYDPTKLQGWIDIELYYGTSPQSGRIPDWLIGWWEVTWRGQSYYYFFNLDRTALYTQIRPKDTIVRPIATDDKGTFAVQESTVTIRWSKTGTMEVFEKAGTDNRMQGTWRGTEPLTAEEM